MPYVQTSKMIQLPYTLDLENCTIESSVYADRLLFPNFVVVAESCLYPAS